MVYTGADGRVRLLFNDDSVVTVSSDSELYLADFAYTAREKKFNARLAKGAMRVITGEITERNPEGFNISTPHVSAGIRGTILNFLVTDSLTEVAVLNTDKAVVVNGQEIRENQRIIVGDGAAPQIAPITAEEKGAILSGGGISILATPEFSYDDSELTQNLVRTENPVDVELPPAPPPILPPAGPTIGTISGNIGGAGNPGIYAGESGGYGTTQPMATVLGNFSVKFDIQTLEVTGAETSGTWTGVSTANVGFIGSGSWEALGTTGQGGACGGGTGICFKVDSWDSVTVEQNYNTNVPLPIATGGVELMVGVTGKTDGSTVDNALSHLHITQDQSVPCNGGVGGCLSIMDTSLGANRAPGGVLKLADGDEGSASMNAEISGGVTH